MLICDVIYMLRKQPRTKKTCSDETFRNGHFNCPFGNGQKLLSAEGLGIDIDIDRNMNTDIDIDMFKQSGPEKVAQTGDSCVFS